MTSFIDSRGNVHDAAGRFSEKPARASAGTADLEQPASPYTAVREELDREAQRLADRIVQATASREAVHRGVDVILSAAEHRESPNGYAVYAGYADDPDGMEHEIDWDVQTDIGLAHYDRILEQAKKEGGFATMTVGTAAADRERLSDDDLERLRAEAKSARVEADKARFAEILDQSGKDRLELFAYEKEDGSFDVEDADGEILGSLPAGHPDRWTWMGRHMSATAERTDHGIRVHSEETGWTDIPESPEA